MVGYLLKNTVTEYGSVSRGVCVRDENDFLTQVTEHTRIELTDGGIRSTLEDGHMILLPEDTIVSMNLWGFTPGFLHEVESRFVAFLDETLRSNPLKGEYFLPAIVSQLLEERKAQVKVLTSRDKWYGVTYQEDRPAVVTALAKMTEREIYPAPLWKG